MKYNPYIFILLIMLLPIQPIADVQAMADECTKDKGCVSECPVLPPIPGITYHLNLQIRTNNCKEEVGTNSRCECKEEVCKVKRKHRNLKCEPCYHIPERGPDHFVPLAENEDYQKTLLDGCTATRLEAINFELQDCKAAARSVANECVVTYGRPKKDCDQELKEAYDFCDKVKEENEQKVLDECTNAFVEGVPLTCVPVGRGSTSGWEQWSTPE